MHLTQIFYSPYLQLNFTLFTLLPNIQRVLNAYAFVGQKKKVLTVFLLLQCFRFVQIYNTHKLRTPESFLVCKKKPVLMSVMTCIENLYA